jgi:hypothetical protein
MNNPGYSGSITLTNTTAITTTTTGGKAIRCILPLTDCVFTTLTDPTAFTNGVSTLSVAADYGTVMAGVPIYGTFTAVTLTSGSAKLYY